MNHKIGVNGAELAYTNTGRGEPIFLLHGWPATGLPFSRSSFSASKTPAYARLLEIPGGRKVKSKRVVLLLGATIVPTSTIRWSHPFPASVSSNASIASIRVRGTFLSVISTTSPARTKRK